MGGKTPSKSNQSYWKNGIIPWVSPKDMKVHEISISEDLITKLAVSEGGMKIILKNTVLMVTRSGILAHSFPIALTLKDITINQDIKAFIPNKAKISPKFTAILLRGLTPVILATCSKAGTTVASIETKLLENFEFALPSLVEQTEIVRRVEELFAFSDQIEQRVKDAQQRVNNLTQSILAKAFRGELTEQWRKENLDLISGENSAEALLAKIKTEREAQEKEKKAKRKTTRRKAVVA